MLKIKYGINICLLVLISILAASLLHAASINISSGEKLNINTSTLNLSEENIDNAGTLQLGTGKIKIGGNWSNSGTFQSDTGTVEFTGTSVQTISGANSFYAFTCTSAGNQLNFEAGKTQTITSAWTIMGSSGNQIKLRSTSDGTQWNVDPQGTRSISYTDVKDSNNISSTPINPTYWTDSGNNTNWTAGEVGLWPYGDPDADGYYTITGYKMRFYDTSNNIITNMATNYATAVKIEAKVEQSYEAGNGSVNGSITADNITISTDGISFPLTFNGTLNLTMDSDEFGTLTGTVEIQNCTLNSGATFFSSGAMDITAEGMFTQNYSSPYSISGTLNVSDSTFQGTVLVTYSYYISPEISGSGTFYMTLIVNADGTGSYSSEQGSGTF